SGAIRSTVATPAAVVALVDDSAPALVASVMTVPSSTALPSASVTGPTAMWARDTPSAGKRVGDDVIGSDPEGAPALNVTTVEPDARRRGAVGREGRGRRGERERARRRARYELHDHAAGAAALDGRDRDGGGARGRRRGDGEREVAEQRLALHPCQRRRRVGEV